MAAMQAPSSPPRRLPDALAPARRLTLVIGLVVALLAAGGAGPARARAEGAPKTTPQMAALLRALGSPLSAARRRAMLALGEQVEGAQTQASLDALRAAWDRAAPLAQVPLALALVRHGRREHIEHLLADLLRRDDPVAQQVLRVLVVHPESAAPLRRAHARNRAAFEDPLAWGLGSDAASKRLAAFARMIRRSTLEEMFIDRKSPRAALATTAASMTSCVTTGPAAGAGHRGRHRTGRGPAPSR